MSNNYSSSQLSDKDLLDEEKLGFYSLYSFHNLFNKDKAEAPTTKTSYISSRLILILTINIILLDAAINFQLDLLSNMNILAYTITIFIACFCAFFYYCLCKQPKNKSGNTFEVPCIPLIPMLSIWCNILLMFNLSIMTWLRFAFWMSLGKYA